MPVQDCESEGRPGYRWGETGACYTYEAGNEAARETARGKAEAQGRAIKAREGGSTAEMQELPEPVALSVPRWRSLAVDETKPIDDYRHIRGEGVFTWREPPFAVTWTPKITEGHFDAELGATCDRAERRGPEIWFFGTFTDDESGTKLLEHVRAKHPLFPSPSIGDDLAVEEIDDLGRPRLTFEQGKIIGMTLLPEQAQEGTFIELDEEPAEPLMACAAEGGPPLYPPKWWLERPPELDEGITPLTITDEGRVYFHLAGETCLLSRPDSCIRVRDDQLSRDFRFAHKGREGDGRGIRTAEGEYVKVTQLLLPGGHAPIRADARTAMRYYDNTENAIGHVRIGWDEKNNLPYGAGSLRPGVTEAQVQMARAVGTVSGDWRPGDQLGADPSKVYLIAAPIVNVPGFPPVSALVASGEVRAFVAPGPMPNEEDDMDETRFNELHTEAHRAELAQNDPATKAFAAFQAGNVEALVDYYCNEAGIPWGEEGARTQCMEIAEGHVDDPAALCQWMMGQCGASPGSIQASAELAQIAFAGLDRQVYGPMFEEMDRRAGA